MNRENNIIDLTEPAENDVFTVREFVAFDYGLAVFFLFLFLVSLKTGFSIFTIFTAGGTIAFFLKGLLNREALRVDCNGIYQNSKLVTSWDNFIEAYLWEDPDTIPRRGDPVLVLRYYKECIEGSFRMTITISDTQNKHEGELMEAIGRFYGLSRGALLQIKQPLLLAGEGE